MGTYKTEVRISNPVLGGNGSNSWHFRTTAGGTTGETEWGELLGILQQFYSDIAGSMPADTVFSSAGEASGVGDDEDTYLSTDSWTVNGSNGSAALPASNCVVVNWRGASGDRSRRGRTFLGPICTAAHAGGGHILSGVLSDFRTAASTLVTSSKTSGNGAWGIWSRQEGVFRDFDGSGVRDKFAILRSRRD